MGGFVWEYKGKDGGLEADQPRLIGDIVSYGHISNLARYCKDGLLGRRRLLRCTKV